MCDILKVIFFDGIIYMMTIICWLWTINTSNRWCYFIYTKHCSATVCSWMAIICFDIQRDIIAGKIIVYGDRGSCVMSKNLFGEKIVRCTKRTYTKKPISFLGHSASACIKHYLCETVVVVLI